jgi:hypothetical protein
MNRQHCSKGAQPVRTAFLVVLALAVGAASDRLLMRETATVHAQDRRDAPTLIIGSETVSVGMSQAAVIAMFSGKYRLLPGDPASGLASPTGGVFIMQNDDVVGTVGFRNGKLINAEREWGAFYSKDGIDGLWTALDGALTQQLPPGRWLPAQIRRAEVETPRMGSRTIDIRFADRTIELQKGRSEGPPATASGSTHYETYSVSEVLPSPLS